MQAWPAAHSYASPRGVPLQSVEEPLARNPGPVPIEQIGGQMGPALKPSLRHESAGIPANQ